MSSEGMASIGTVDSTTDRGCARLPTTTTRSSSCTAISTSRVVVVSAPTVTALRAAVVKPGSVNVTSYVPGSSAGIENRPARSVKTVGCGPLPVVACAPTATPGRTKPVVSVTVPDRTPSWARAAAGARAAATTTSAMHASRTGLDSTGFPARRLARRGARDAGGDTLSGPSRS